MYYKNIVIMESLTAIYRIKSAEAYTKKYSYNQSTDSEFLAYSSSQHEIY